ncbi:MAG: acyltransferase family protein [Fermentimonas sp.]
MSNALFKRADEENFKKSRIRSIDALRGFDMFWIMGIGGVIVQLAKIEQTPFWNSLAVQFSHPYWDGFTFWDMIFPLFMFLSGLSSPYSIDKQLKNGRTKNQILWKIVKRGLILILLGVIYNARGIELRPLAEYRYASVLGKIGVSYVFANIIYLYSKPKTQIIWYWTLLIGYWLLLKFTSAPGYPPGDLTEAGNFMSYFDRNVLPGKLSRGIHDTVGLLCTITGVATTLLGVVSGHFLKKHPLPPIRKVLWFVVIGIGLILLAIVWNLDFPINKNLWSSSFTMLTSGISLLLFALFYFIIDIRGHHKWTFFFQVIGMNSIFIYVSPIFIDYSYIAKGLFGWIGQLSGAYEVPVMGICTVLVSWLVLYFLYKKNVFLRI